MTPYDFIAKWRVSALKERSASQEHFIVLCRLLGEATPAEADRLRPDETRQSLTERAAASFATVAQALRERGHPPQAVAHFVNRLVFCMFADDVGLLPEHMFTRMLRQARRKPEHSTELAGALFRVMASGGRVGFEAVAWFNRGLFDDHEGMTTHPEYTLTKPSTCLNNRDHFPSRVTRSSDFARHVVQ